MSTIFRRKCLVLACFAWCGAALVGCGGPGPDKVYQTWSSAVKAGNFPASWECLTPQTRGTVLQIMVLDADLLSEKNPGAKDALKQVFAKYGLNPQDATFRQSRLQVSNAAGLAADLDNVFRQFQRDLGQLTGSRYHKLSSIWTALAQSGLGPSQTQGTRATAAVQGKIPHTAENASFQAVFEKVDGHWLIADLEAGPGGAAAVAGGAGIPKAGGGPPMPGGAAGAMPAAAPPGAHPGAMAGQPGGPGAGGPAGGVMPARDPQALMANKAGDPAIAGAVPAGTPLMAGKAGEGPANAGAAGAMPAVPPLMAGKAGEPAVGAGAAGGAMPAGDPKGMIAKAGAPPAGADGEPAGAGAAANGLANPGMAGRRGEGGAGGPGGGQNKYKPGSLEHTVETFIEKIGSGDYTSLDYVISSRAKGLLGDMRKEEVSSERQEDLKATFAGATPQPETLKNTGAAIMITLKGKLGHSIVLTVGKEDGVFKVRDMKISEPGASKKR